jgi:hypothetical protein
MCYVDDILIIHDQSTVDPNLLTSDIKRIHKYFTFTPTYQMNERMSFTDLLLRNGSSVEIDIHRKPTTIETSVHFLFSFTYT